LLAVSSVKELCEKIWDIEEKYNLFNKEIKGVYFWKLIRMPLYYEITKKIKIYDQAHTHVSQSFIDKLLYLPRALINTHFYGAINRNTQKDYLIFEHPRKVKVNGVYIDKYTHYLTDELEDDSYEIIDKPYLRKHFNKPSANRSYFEHFSFIDYIKRKIFTLKLDAKDHNLVSNIQNDLEKTFKIKLDLLKKIEHRIIHFKNEVEYYDKLLNKRKPKKVFLVVSYGKEALIHSCQKNNIPAVEIQHGTISKYHLGYSFPNDCFVHYFPDELYLFGQYWFDSTPLPLEINETKNYGFPYLEKKLAEYNSISVNQNQVLFISQGVLGKNLSKLAYEFAKKNRKYNIIFKLHPGEYDRWDQEYKDLLLAKKLSNFKVIDNNHINLYELFVKSDYQVGVFSTAIYEGLTLNCKTILLDLPGVEYMEYLIEEDIVKFAGNAEELADYIRFANFTPNYDKDYFFSGL
jgi:hypothetical protein